MCVSDLPAVLLNNAYLGIERIDLGTIETSSPELTPPICGDMTFFATIDAPPSVRAGSDLRGSGVDRRVSLGLTLAAHRVRAMLVFAMRLAADWAPCVSSASDSRVTPTPAVLAERDTGLGGCSTNEALPPEDDDALVDQALRAGPVLGVPDVDVGRGGGAAVRLLDDPRHSRQVDVDRERGGLEGGPDISGSGGVAARVAVTRTADDLEVRRRRRETRPDLLGEVGIGGV